MSRNTAHRRNRIHAADSQANSLISLATEVRTKLRAKLSRPPEETPRAEVLLPVGIVARLASVAHEIAMRHRTAVADALEATTRLTHAQQEIADLKRHLTGTQSRLATVEADLRRRKLAAGEEVA